MTGRTHDLAAITLLNGLFLLITPPHMSVATALVSVAGCFIGGLVPDIDEGTSLFWQRIPMGTFFGRLIHPLLGSHRMLTHSIFGMAVFGFLLKELLKLTGTVVLVDMELVWWATMIGYFSHLLADSVTHEGVPWLFPIPIRFGFPPLRALRIKTGGIIEFAIVFPLLLVTNGYFFVHYSTFYIVFLKSFVS